MISRLADENQKNFGGFAALFKIHVMTKEQVAAFLHEVGEICRKHGMEGFVGMWFDKHSDDMGRFNFWDCADTSMKQVGEFVLNRIEGWLKEGKSYQDKGRVTGVVDGDAKKN